MSGKSVDFSSELNSQQLVAVYSKAKSTLIVAGAGSGKTRTLIYRVAYLLKQGIDPRHILLLTFTNKAAKEMLGRVHRLGNYNTNLVFGGTFHSVCARILRSHSKELGFSGEFSIFDREDQKRLLRQILSDLKSEDKEFPKPRVLIELFSLSSSLNASVADILFEQYSYLERFLPVIEEIQNAYQEKKRDASGLDFEDLLVQAVKLLKENESICSLYQGRFRHILVDEYQDVNPIQFELIELLGKKAENIMVVGDDAQAIYSWRGAEIDYILDFPKRHTGTEICKLEMNYRSTNRILALGNAILENNTGRFQKNLFSAREKEGCLPLVSSLPSPRYQAEFVVERIKALQFEGVPLGEIAILYRSHHQSLELEALLIKESLSYIVTSGVRFFERAHIKDLISFFRFVSNPRDEVSFSRLTCLLQGVGEKSARKLWKEWRSSKWIDGSVAPDYKLLANFSIPKKAANQWQEWVKILVDLRNLCSEKNTLEKMTRRVLEGGYDSYMQQSFENYPQRKQDMEELISLMQRYQFLDDFLSEVSLFLAGDEGHSRYQRKQDSITLSTVHQAKGLEWRAVFVVGMAEGIFPSNKVLETGKQDLLEEERRLFYVAVTRAKDFLYLTYPVFYHRGYGDGFLEASSFLREVSEDLLEQSDATHNNNY